MLALLTLAHRGAKLLAFMRGVAQQEKSAHTGNRAQVTSMEGLYDATTLCVLLIRCAVSRIGMSCVKAVLGSEP